MKISGGTTLGNCATGSPTMVTSPTMTMMIEITMATIGRLMKNFDMSASPEISELIQDQNRVAQFHPFGMILKYEWHRIFSLRYDRELSGSASSCRRVAVSNMLRRRIGRVH